MATAILVLSLIGTALTSSILIPQLVKTWKSNSATDLSYWMLGINILQSIFWIISTILTGISNGWGGMPIPLIITNIISGSCAIILLIKKYQLSKPPLK